MKAISTATAKLSNEDIVKLERNGKIDLVIDGNSLSLSAEDFEIATKDIPGWTVASNASLTVALDLQLTDALINEGIARELVNRIQNLRKEKGLEVTDKIKLILKNDDLFQNAVQANKAYICSETLTEELVMQDQLTDGTIIEINDLETEISILKL